MNVKQIFSGIAIGLLGVVCCSIIFLLIGLWHLGSIAQSLKNIGLARASECTFFTGDIILFQHKRYDGHGLDYMVTHMGSILVDDIYGPLLIDINPTKNGAFDASAIQPVIQCEALQLVPIQQVIDHYPGKIFVRPMLKPMTVQQEATFKHEVLHWGTQLSYMEDVKNRKPFTWISLAISTLVPEISYVIANLFTKLALPRISSFCTELLSTAYEKCGVLPPDKIWAYSRGPLSWLYGIDPRTTLVWGREIQLI